MDEKSNRPKSRKGKGGGRGGSDSYALGGKEGSGL